MKNFKITGKEDSKEYWISRAMAVVGLVIGTGGKEPVFLVSQRGPGCPDHVGKWAFSCGYLDWDETLVQAVCRELHEELGLVVEDQSSIELFKVVDDPARDARQNVVFRYILNIPLQKLESDLKSGIINKDSYSRGGEKDEVSDIKLIPLSEVDNYTWAFNHREVISELVDRIALSSVPKKYQSDVYALQSKYGDKFVKGFHIEIALQDLLPICPRERARIDAYVGLGSYLKNKLGITLTVKSQKNKEGKDF